MKKLTLIIGIILLSVMGYGQYSKSYAPPKGWKSPELYLPVTVLLSTFAVNDYMINNKVGGEKATAQIAATGIATSLATHFIFRAIRKNKKNYTLKF